MRNVVAACQSKNARLVFFDNVYMYGRVAGAMTETTPISPCSRKGGVRARIADYLMTGGLRRDDNRADRAGSGLLRPVCRQEQCPLHFGIPKTCKGEEGSVDG